MFCWVPAGKREVLPVEGLPVDKVPEPPRKVVCWVDPLGMIWAEEASAPPHTFQTLVAMSVWLSANGYFCLIKPEETRAVLVSRHPALCYKEISEAGHSR